MPNTPDAAPQLSRRGLLGLAGAGAAGAALGAGAMAASGAGGAAPVFGAQASPAQLRYPFHGAHQSGIVTPAQDRLHFATFTMADGARREDLISLLEDWSVAADALMAGRPIGETGAVNGPSALPPDDTGEALDLGPAGLTITFGFGPTLFELDGIDRFGIAAQRPAELAPLPRFNGDALAPEYTGGDLCVQACANDPQVAVHAIRNLSRIAFGRAALHWSQLGLGRTSSTTKAQATPRNLFGFKDGTANLKAEDTEQLAASVWVDTSDGPAWLTGGSYLVARRIRMTIETWDHAQLGEQEKVIGRSKAEGAPLSGGREFSEVDMTATSADGTPLIDPRSHVALARPANNNGAALLRRGYNFVDGNDSSGRLNAGLFFLAYMRTPEQFIAVQRSLSRDLMNEYIKHVGSAVFAIPPGARAGSYVGAELFA
ncbi:MAG: iron uptake transporter deferrochelatase/peroxidase subunit [Agromyces sp.]